MYKSEKVQPMIQIIYLVKDIIIDWTEEESPYESAFYHIEVVTKTFLLKNFQVAAATEQFNKYRGNQEHHKEQSYHL